MQFTILSSLSILSVFLSGSEQETFDFDTHIIRIERGFEILLLLLLWYLSFLNVAQHASFLTPLCAHVQVLFHKAEL